MARFEEPAMRLAFVVVIVALTGCQPRAELDITILLSDSLTPVETSSIASLQFDISGAASSHAVRRPAHPFQSGAESIVFATPHVAGQVLVQVIANDAGGVPVAVGSVNVQLDPHTIPVTVRLDRQLRAVGSACLDNVQCRAGTCVGGFCDCRNDDDCAGGQYCTAAATCDSWSPLLEPGLVLWLDPDSGPTTQGSTVLTWADRSGRVSWATARGTPAPTVLRGVLGGHDVVHFNGVGYLDLGDPSNLRWGTKSFIVAMVMRYTGSYGGAGAALYQKTHYDLDPYEGPGLFVEDPFFRDHDHDVIGQVNNVRFTTGLSSNDNQWRIVALRRFAQGTQLVVRVNGQSGSIDVSDPVNIDTMGYRASIGGRLDGTQQLVGDIAEVIAVMNDESDLLPTRIESYLKAKYGL
jgi:hypothetical protein